MLVPASLRSPLRTQVGVSALRALHVTALALGANQRESVRVTKASDHDIVVTGTFAAPRSVLFDALTAPEQVKQWMAASGMSLAEAHVDARAGGSFRLVFQRASGRKLEVRGAYRTFDPPRSFTYLETYDFSPLRIEVTTVLEERRGATRLKKTLHYFSRRERDDDFDAVATSSREAYAKLAGYLTRRADTGTASDLRNGPPTAAASARTRGPGAAPAPYRPARVREPDR